MVSSASHPCLDMGDCNASSSAALPAMPHLGPMAAGDYDAELDIDDFFDAAFPAVLAPAPRRAGAVADALDAEIEEALAGASPDAAALCRGGVEAQGAAAASGGRAHCRVSDILNLVVKLVYLNSQEILNLCYVILVSYSGGSSNLF